VGCEAHVSNWLLLLDHLATQLLNVLQRCLDVGNIDRDDSVLDLVVALGHSTVDGSRLLGHPGLVVSGRGDYPMVFHSRVLADIPSEGLLVEALGAFYVVGRYLEVYNPTVVHVFLTCEGGAKPV